MTVFRQQAVMNEDQRSWDATKAAGATKSSVGPASGQKPLNLVSKIDRTFWKT